MRKNPRKARRIQKALIGISCITCLGSCAGISKEQMRQAEIQYDMGVGELKNGRVAEALRLFEDACHFHPDFAEAHNALGLTLHFLHKDNEALAHFDRALAVRPDFSEVHNNRAQVFISQGRFREALADLERALQDIYLPERYLAESNIGWALFNVGQEEEGLKRVMNALALNAGYCVGYEYLGIMYQRRKALPEATRELNQLVQKCPDYAPGYLHLSKVYLMSGEVDRGCETLQLCTARGRMSEVGQQCDRLQRASCPPRAAE